MQYHGIGVPVDSWEEFLVAKLDGITDFDLEVGHKFNLFVVPIAEFIKALVDRLTIFEELPVAVLEGTSEQEQGANVGTHGHYLKRRQARQRVVHEPSE